MTLAVGTNSCSSSSRFGATSTFNWVASVTLPPGGLCHHLQGLRDIELLVDAGDIAAGMGAAVHVLLDPIVLSCVNMGSGRGAT